ncbi:MAG: beta-N-acetylhexosaminidase [Bacteroidales bacterium]|nr:beta-N-acetylhexosaminidase [Bacteroidales bacterium]
MMEVRLITGLMATWLLSACTGRDGVVPVIPEPARVHFFIGKTQVEDPAGAEYKESALFGKEAYRIDISRNRIVVTAGTDAGRFYADQTLLQLYEVYGAGQVPCCRIEDAPRYSWRSFMLDESRHFFGEEYVLRTLDLMARYKLNKFHWHLTDTDGWRLEINAFPELTRVGSVGNHTDIEAPAAFYTQEQVRRIIAYAAERQIEVIPEVDMPGHATAAIRAYPALGGGFHPDYPNFTYNIGLEETCSFLETVLDEVAALFPGRYIHLGGDEVSYGWSAWDDCPEILALMEREGLHDKAAVCAFFLGRMARYILNIGKIPVVWCDAQEMGLDEKEVTVAWWRHDREDLLARCLEAGLSTVLCPRLPLYFDYVQSPDHVEGAKWRKTESSDLEDLYGFPDNRASFPADISSIIGLSAHLWTERIETPERADFMTWPRMLALAETSWTLPERKEYALFLDRLPDQLAYLSSRHVYYYHPLAPDSTPEPPMPVRYHQPTNH